MKKAKALFLFSGGLDSLVGVKLLKAQGLKVDLIFFEGFFWKADRARTSARANGLKIKVIDFSEKHLAIVRKPRHGYGKAINPCVDCHALMLRLAKEIMEKQGYDFVATGEVLGQRPMSQTKDRLKVVEKESGLQGFLLRPLSAQMLQITIPEKTGQVDRHRLEAISGRSRKKQMILAQKFNLKEYPTPAGGCLLTDKGFSVRLKELWRIKKDIGGNDIDSLKVGRHYWLGKTKIIVGRDEGENKKIKQLARKGDKLISMKEFAGPTTMIRPYGSSSISKKALVRAEELTQQHSPRARKKQVSFLVESF